MTAFVHYFRCTCGEQRRQLEGAADACACGTVTVRYRSGALIIGRPSATRVPGEGRRIRG